MHEDAKKLIENTINIFLTVDNAHLFTIRNESELLMKITY
ncbi:hypothetical protein CMTB2_04047 [Caminibacter mediatlanticus TB-2]|uniref:Uncharacterized protein n=1 Tax=Caminibacter mediatlanticus TB-2 TaxID=391592 RepID=A0AAI9F1T8_9BACT|nr:hypothetical protein CMTB2_04047 [Caminibacter mediatlanticus TB-2]